MFSTRAIACVLGALLLAACKTTGTTVPYPANVSVDGLPDMFIAGLPGVRAKPLVGATSDATGGSYRIDLPVTWQGTSGAAPDKSLEIFVIQGELSVADVKLKRGGYAYLPPGTLGFNLKSATGARVLYFLDDVEPSAAIRTPLIMESTVLEWEDTETEGMSVKELRADPGSGARAWLLKIDKGTEVPWESSSVNREGYFLTGNYHHTECVAGEPVTQHYYPGGYLYRPADSINGGPEAIAESTSIWFFRELSESKVTTHDECELTATSY